MNARHRYVATAATGTESLVVHELRGLGLPAGAGRPGTVLFEGTRLEAARACVHSRVAARLLEEVASFRCDGKEALYQGTRTVPWEEHIDPRMTMAVRVKAAVRTPFASSTYAAQVIKDAVVDTIRDRKGARPSVDREKPDVLVVAHLGRDEATLYLDVAGEPLHRRGYRAVQTEAPLKETLAAAVVLFARYDGKQPLCDPMTGSGTLVIEAARVARGMAPRAHRELAMEGWPSIDVPTRRSLQSLRADARAAERSRAPSPLWGSDLSAEAVAAARQNARAAGVEHDIDFQVRDVRDLPHPGPGALITVNPPYGDRLDPGTGNLADLYRAFAERVRSFTGVRLIALSGNPRFERAIDLRPRWSREVTNGAIPCQLSYWEL
jgi:23S rRNA (guanine2445-N2)-methyltransferase